MKLLTIESRELCGSDEAVAMALTALARLKSVEIVYGKNYDIAARQYYISEDEIRITGVSKVWNTREEAEAESARITQEIADKKELEAFRAAQESGRAV